MFGMDSTAAFSSQFSSIGSNCGNEPPLHSEVRPATMDSPGQPATSQDSYVRTRANDVVLLDFLGFFFFLIHASSSMGLRR